jgi:hypothetical protein
VVCRRVEGCRGEESGAPAGLAVAVLAVDLSAKKCTRMGDFEQIQICGGNAPLVLKGILTTSWEIGERACTSLSVPATRSGPEGPGRVALIQGPEGPCSLRRFGGLKASAPSEDAGSHGARTLRMSCPRLRYEDLSRCGLNGNAWDCDQDAGRLRKATAGPSTPLGAKNAPNFAQDDKLLMYRSG